MARIAIAAFALASFLAGFFAADFLAADKCLDAGGKWQDQGILGVCEGIEVAEQG